MNIHPLHIKRTCPVDEIVASYGLSLAYIINVFGEMAFMDRKMYGMHEKHESTTWMSVALRSMS